MAALLSRPLEPIVPPATVPTPTPSPPRPAWEERAIGRRFVLAGALLPLVFGWFALAGTHARWWSAELAVWLAVGGSALLYAGLVLAVRRSLRLAARDRQAAYEVLHQSEERFRQLAENMRDVVWMVDPATGAMLYVSPRFEAVWGRSCASLYQNPETWSDAIFDEDRARTLLAIRSLRETGSYDVEFRIIRPDGAIRWVRNRGFAVRNEQGDLYRIAGISEDLTERRQADEQLQAQLNRISLLNQITRAIAERTDLPSLLRVVVLRLEDDLPADFAWVATCDPEPVELTVAACGLKSWTAVADLGLDVGATVLIENAGLQPCLRAEQLDVADTAGTDAPMLRGLGMMGLRSVLATPMLVGEQITGVLVVARQGVHAFSAAEAEFMWTLAEHVALAAHSARLNDTLQRAYDDLRQTQQAISQQERLRALGQMASGIAHDINNALSPIVGYADLLGTVEPSLSTTSQHFVRMISLAADDISRIVMRLREFYRQRDVSEALQPMQLNDLVRQVVELTRARWRDIPQQQGVTIEVRLELQEDLPACRGIEAELREALTNLLFNAVDAMPEGGTITLRTQARGTQVALEVVDTGVGMDAETLHHCLEPFYTTKGERGTGLGLPMVFGVMQRHDGDVQVESERGQGTTMRLLLPVAAPGAALATQAEAEAQLPVRPLRILCIDDEPMLRALMQEMLERDGHEVTVADGARNGLAAFLRSTSEGRPFEVVVTDLGMPYIDGREVARVVKAASASTGVVLLTGWGARFGEHERMPPHVDAVLSKPPKIALLREALRQVAPG